jgi:hypothetical protein
MEYYRIRKTAQNEFATYIYIYIYIYISDMTVSHSFMHVKVIQNFK